MSRCSGNGSGLFDNQNTPQHPTTPSEFYCSLRGRTTFFKIAFSVGNQFTNTAFMTIISLFQMALGSDGPPTPASPPVTPPWQISDQDNYGHSDYLPPTDPARWPSALPIL